MKELLIAISILAFENNTANKSTEQQIQSKWLGFPPATEVVIKQNEERLNIILPEDYKEFLKVTNGFNSCSDATEPTFLPINEVDYLNKIDKSAIECYPFLHELENAILIAGKNEEQYFLLIPPENKIGKWIYWKFANWIPGEHEFENLTEYFLWVKSTEIQSN